MMPAPFALTAIVKSWKIFQRKYSKNDFDDNTTHLIESLCIDAPQLPQLLVELIEEEVTC